MNRRLLLFLIVGGTLFGALLVALDRARAPRLAAPAPGTPAAGRSAAKPAAPPRNPWEAEEARNRPGNAAGIDPWGPTTRPAAPPAPREEKPDIRKFARVVAVDAGHLKADKTVIRLYGISAPEHGETCDTAAGRTWPCGARALGALRALLRTRAVECEVKGEIEQELVALCRVGTTDISNWLVRQGWAELDEDTDAYADALKAAKKDRLGLWSDGRQARD